jgi:hypothetical protein
LVLKYSRLAKGNRSILPHKWRENLLLSGLLSRLVGEGNTLLDVALEARDAGVKELLLLVR